MMVDNNHRCASNLEEVKIEVTQHCLLNCIHCSSNGNNTYYKEMEWKICKRIIEEALEIGIKEIVFTGGEALLWNHINLAIKKCVNTNVKISLYSTGYVDNFKQKISRLNKIGLKNICLSLFGSIEEIHEQITMVKGSLKKTIEAIKYCSHLGMKTDIHFVPLSINFNELKPLASLCNHLGSKQISILRFVPQGRGLKNKKLILNKKQNLTLKKDILLLRRNGINVRLGSPYNFLMLNKFPKCCSGQDRITISPNYEIYPCDAFKQISPNKIKVIDKFRKLDSHSLKECWKKSNYLKYVREVIKSKDFGECNECKMLLKCYSGCLSQKIIEFGKYKGPDPLCLKKVN